MERHSIRLGSLAGIDIRVHVTWFAIFALVTISLATGYYPFALRSAGAAEAWALAAASALLLFTSVLIHELAHSLVAKSQGLAVRSITLFLFGGISDLAAEPGTPRSELLVAAVGPATSLVLGLVLAIAALPMAAGSVPDALVGYLAIVNLLLGGFNLAPGFPLDGGRVLHAIAWRATRSAERAIRIAGFGGRLTGGLLFVAGAYLLVSGAPLDGIWLALIGWFLQGAASDALARVTARERLRGVTVADAMAADPATADARESVEAVLQRLVERSRSAAAVTDGDEVAVVTSADLTSVPRDRRPWTAVRSVMRTPTADINVALDEPLVAALDALDAAATDAAPIVDRGRVVGMLLRDDIARFIATNDRRRAEVGRAA